MGLFKKKSDPLAQRARTLNRKIAELEAQIARLNQNAGPEPPAVRAGAGRAGAASAGGGGGVSSPGGSSGGPASGRVASRFAGPPAGVPSSHDPVFERMPPRPSDPASAGESPGREAMALGLKRPAWSQWWRKLKSRIVDPPPANEKLVNYLAAGGIQGLRPLRFERRIARNRIVFVCVVLGLLLWGLLVMFRHTR